MHDEISTERRFHSVPARQQVLRQRPTLTDDRSWGIQDVAYFLSESMVRNLERAGDPPALPRIGTRIIFDPKVVRAFRDGWRPARRGRASVPPRILDDGHERE